MKISMTIAGSDSGGGAGIQADLKTFQSLGVFGTTVITSVTAQNTCGLKGVNTLDDEFVGQQIDAVANDMNVSAVKTGMLANGEIIKRVAQKISEHKFPWVVVDPVMVATSGDLLLEEEAIDIMKSKLFPYSHIVTPNIPEAETLAEMPIKDQMDMDKAAQKIKKMGVDYVLIKGGHSKKEAEDHLFFGESFQKLSAPRIGKVSLHGTGCTMAAAICAYLAQGQSILTSVTRAKEYVTRAIETGFAVGQCSNVLNHWAFHERQDQGAFSH